MKKTHQKVEQQLLQARDRSLQQVERGSLRPHGKLWGMDVFSWYNPMVYELESTLSSFPAPVLWFGNAADVNRLVGENVDCLSNVRVVCTYDHAGFSLPEAILEQVGSCLGTGNLNDALSLVKAVRKNQGILLFTASGEDWKSSREAFEFFLELQQS